MQQRMPRVNVHHKISLCVDTMTPSRSPLCWSTQGDYLPAILVGQHTDDTFVMYGGSYLLSGTQIRDGRFRLFFDAMLDASTIFEVLDELDCTAPGM